MAADIWRSRDETAAPGRRERLEYGVVFALAFTLFLLPTLVTRLLRGSASPEAGRSLISETRAAAHAAVGYAFMV